MIRYRITRESGVGENGFGEFIHLIFFDGKIESTILLKRSIF